jgi:excisionase family DNA binding protein
LQGNHYRVTFTLMATETLVTSRQAADLLGVGTTTIHRWADDGKLPVAHKHDGLRGPKLYRLADVEALALKLNGVQA